MKMNVHAGHNPDGKRACGAIGIIKESTENRKVCKEVIRLLRENGVTVYNCTVDDGKDVGDVVYKIVNKCNKHNVDFDMSIHFNSGAKDKKGNDKSTGVEVLIRSDVNKELVQMANRICKSVSKLGFKNRGIKYRKDLYFLNNTNDPALLVECCFVDDKDDIELYNYKTMAKAIVEGVLDKTLSEVKKDDKKEDIKKEDTKNDLKKEETKTEKIPSLKGYKGFSIVDGLTSYGYDSSFEYRKKLWSLIGKTTKYKGTATQNTTLLKVLKQK